MVVSRLKPSPVAQLSMHSPIGALSISEHNGVLVSLDWGWGRDQTQTPLTKEAVRQLNAYFDGSLKNFTLPMKPGGSDFQRSVWQDLLKIPYGSTLSYGEIALSLKSGARPVGTACGRNPLPILIPCHRVVGANGALGGYSGEGGLATKTALLLIEGIEIGR